MQLYLLRHGIAEERAVSGRDEDRALTADGIAKLNAVLLRAAGAGFAPSRILTSPTLRTMQTAHLAAQAGGHTDPLHPSNALLSEATPEELWNEVRVYEAEPVLLLVTHQPLISDAAAWMLERTARHLVPPFFPATLVRIDFAEVGRTPQGLFQWGLTP